jgi:hypothetical protein
MPEPDSGAFRKLDEAVTRPDSWGRFLFHYQSPVVGFRAFARKRLLGIGLLRPVLDVDLGQGGFLGLFVLKDVLRNFHGELPEPRQFQSLAHDVTGFIGLDPQQNGG